MRTCTLARATASGGVSVPVNKPASSAAVMNRSFILAVLMLLHNMVTQSPVPVVGGINVRLDTLAVTLADGCWLELLDCASARINGTATPTVAIPTINFLFVA